MYVLQCLGCCWRCLSRQGWPSRTLPNALSRCGEGGGSLHVSSRCSPALLGYKRRQPRFGACRCMAMPSAMADTLSHMYTPLQIEPDNTSYCCIVGMWASGQIPARGGELDIMHNRLREEESAKSLDHARRGSLGSGGTRAGLEATPTWNMGGARWLAPSPNSKDLIPRPSELRTRSLPPLRI